MKIKLNKQLKNILIVLLIIGVIIASMFISNNSNANKYFKEISIEEYFNMIDSEDLSHVYIGRPTCSICVKFTPLLEKYTLDNKIAVNYLNTDKLSTADFDKLNEQLTKAIGSDWGGSTPTLVTLGIGKVNNYKIGYDVSVGDKDLNTYFGINSSIDTSLNSIDINEYLTLIKEDKDNIIMIGRPTCPYCVKITPVLEQLQETRGIMINYLNTDELDKNSFDLLSSSFAELEEFGTPYIIITSNNKIKASSEGYKEFEEMNQFFAENGL